jgi:hypothetical protein
MAHGSIENFTVVMVIFNIKEHFPSHLLSNESVVLDIRCLKHLYDKVILQTMLCLPSWIINQYC